MKKRFFITILLNLLIANISHSITARDDIPLHEYYEFAMNLGKYEAGNQNILSYDKNGNQAVGIYKYSNHRDFFMWDKTVKTDYFYAPMPDFRATSIFFENTIVGDSQIIATAKHIGAGQPKNYVDRYRRTDISNLYQNYSNDVNNSNSFRDKFSEYYGNSTNFQINNSTNSSDFTILRNKKVMIDAIPYDILPEERYNQVLEYGTLVARAGHGDVYFSNGKTSTQNTFPSNGIAGGYTRINSLDYLSLNENQNISIKLEKENTTNSFKTPLDNATAGSDSGSLILLWDEKVKKWYFGGVVLGGNGNYSNDNKFTLNLIKNYNKEINETSKNLATNDFKDQKNHIYTKGISLNVENSTDTNFARLIFKENSSISGNGTLTTAGIEIADGKNVDFNLKLNDKIIRKIGKGTLTVKSNSDNGQYSIGDGILSLENDGKVAKKILIASGRATVKLNRDNQLDNTEFVFGLSGGKLDLNSYNQKFNDIYHMDKGAKIINSNNLNKSTLTFTPNGDRVFLGEFDGNLDVNYNSNSTWELRSRNSNLKNLNIQNGTVFIKGDSMLGGTNNLTTIAVKDMFYENKFTSENINISDNSTLKLGRGAKINGNINVSDLGKLNIEATGKVLTDAKKMTLNEEENYQEKVNKIIIENDITFKNGDNNNLTINLENNNIAVINGNILGNLNAEKLGSGNLFINSDKIENGNLYIKDGIVTIKNINQAKNINYSFDNFSILRLENTNSNDLGNVLNKISTTSKGVISIDNDLTDISTLTALNNLENIYLGSNKNITIGSDTLDFSKGISTLRLGGDGGTINIKGINNISNILDLIIGTNEKNLGGKVVVKDDIQGTNVFVTVNNGVIYEGTTKNIVTLNYGSSGNTSLSNISENSEGIYLTNNSDNNDISNYNKLYIGTNKELELNNLTVSDKYLLSSINDGNLKVNFSLDKDTIIDAQGFSNGIVTINKSTDKNIEVLGNKFDNSGSITLKLGIDNAIKNLSLKSGSTLDINDKNVSINFKETNSNSNIIGNGNLNILNDENKDIVLNSNISGSSNISLNSGSLLLNNISDEFNGSITINDNAKYILSKNNNYSIKFTGNDNNSSSLDILDDVSIVSNLVLEKDIITKSNNSNIKYSNVKFNNHLLTLKDQTFEIENITQNDKIKLDNSKYLLNNIVPNISGNGTIENIGEKVLISNLTDFSGEIIAKNNDVEISNLSNTTLKSENNNIILNTDENFSNLNIYGNLLLKGNNKFEKDLPNLDNVNKLILSKDYTIDINNNFNVPNLENFGNLKLNFNNNLININNYSGNGNLNILNDENKDIVLNSNISGSSNISLNSGSLLLNNISDEFNGSITINDNAKYILSKNNNYSIKFTGNNNNSSSLDILDDVSIVSNLVLEKDIITKSNNSNIKYSNVKFNNHLLTLKDQTFEIENITQNDKIKLDNSKYLLNNIVPNISGNGTIENIGEKVLISNLTDFSGEIIAKNSDVEISNLSNATLKSENNNIILNTDENFSNLNIYGNLLLKGNNKFEKDLPNLDNINKLIIDDKYTLKLNDNIDVENLENNGNIYINNNSIVNAANYTGDGILNIDIDKTTDNIVRIKNSSKINSNISFDEETAKYLLNNKIKVGDIKNLNILNVEELKYNNLVLNNTNGVLSYIVKTNILNEYILLKNIFKLNDLSYSNLISKNSASFDISYLHTSEFNNEELNNFKNSKIKSSSNTFGINLSTNKAFTYANLYANASYMFTNIKTESNETLKDLDTHTLLLSLITKFGLENYGAGLILNLNSTFSDNKYISLDTGLSGYYNKQFKMNNIDLLLKNEINVLRHNQLYYNSDENNRLDVLTPYKISYLIGTKLKYDKYSLDINSDFSYDFSKVKIFNNIEEYNFINQFNFKLDSSLKYNINSNFNLKFDNILNISQKHLTFKTAIGFEYLY